MCQPEAAADNLLLTLAYAICNRPLSARQYLAHKEGTRLLNLAHACLLDKPFNIVAATPSDFGGWRDGHVEFRPERRPHDGQRGLLKPVPIRHPAVTFPSKTSSDTENLYHG